MSKLSMSRNETDLEEKYFSIVNKPSSTKVTWPGSAVSRSPLFSRGYYDCVGTIIFGENWYGALSHYDHSTDSIRPSFYIQRLVNDLRECSGSDKLECVTFGGNSEHLNSVNLILARNGVRKIGELRYCCIVKPSDLRKMDQLPPTISVAVIPETREIIFSYDEKYFWGIEDISKVNNLV